jgi:acetyl esterase/lipase
MILRRWVIAFIVLGATLRAADVIPIEDFARVPNFSDMQLSPDGQYLAFLREYDGKLTLFISNMAKMETSGVEPGYPGVWHDLNKQDVFSFEWIGDRRVAFKTAFRGFLTGLLAVDCDGQHGKVLGGSSAIFLGNNMSEFHATETIHSFGTTGQNILLLGWVGKNLQPGERATYLDVMKVDTLRCFYEPVAKNPGNVIAWGADNTGCVRLGFMFTGDFKTGFIYRENENAPWHALPSSNAVHGQCRPLGCDSLNQTFYVAALSPQKRDAIYPFDPATGVLGDALVDDPDYDVAPVEGLVPQFDGIPLDQRIFSTRKQALVGVYYLTEGPHARWLDSEFAGYQEDIDAALPQTINLITGHTRDDKRLLVLAFSDKNPGAYYLFDTTSHTLIRVGARMGWIKPESMAAMHPIAYRARDGQLIHGYLTLPVSRQDKNLPMVVMPHGDPWVRDVWGFDPLVQLLANRGYAVLQMNYRGSPGYGEDFYEKARHEIGRGIQDDIEDGTRWAIAKGLADPRRVAIAGSGYGGYSALFALGHTQDLYRCGISIAGVTDWLSIIKDGQTNSVIDKFTYTYWAPRVDDPQSDEEFLKSISPVNFADEITAPLLIIQGKDDRMVQPIQAHRMIDALKEAGHPPESLFVADEGHGFTKEEDCVKEYKAIEAFLLKNLGPGAPPLESAKGESPAAAPAGSKPAG